MKLNSVAASDLGGRRVRAANRWRKASWAAAAVLLLMAPAAKAQSFFGVFEPSPRQIVRGLVDAGYDLRSDLVRRGDVYVVDVASFEGDDQRLVIDARSGRIVERFPGRGMRWRARNADDAWDEAPRPPADIARPWWHQRLMGAGEAPRSPPPPIEGVAPRAVEVIPAPAVRRDQVARTEDNPKPNILYGDGSSSNAPDAAKAKPKPHVVKRKPNPLAKATPEPTATPEAAAPAPTPTPVAKIAPAAPVVVAKPPEPAPSPVQTQAAVDPPKAVAVKPAPQVKSEPQVKQAPAPKPKAVNDLPVTPLD
jgi:hypothetical protein